MTQHLFQYFWLVAFAAYVIWGIASGGFDTLLAGFVQKRRRKHYRPDPDADPLQAMLHEHVAVMAPNAGIAVAVVTPVGVRQLFAGHIDGKATPAPDADTPFEIGSITKTFTAALLVAMVNKGLVELDTPLDDLLAPKCRLGQQVPAKVTLESLATHCSGLPRLPWGLPMWAGMLWTPKQPYRFISRKVVTHWLRGRRIRFGARYRYSNLGYGVLGDVLAQCAGLDYAAAMRQCVLQPLGLDHTSFDAGSVVRVAQPHTALGRPMPVWNLRALAPAGGIHSTLADMTRWLQANLATTPPLDARLHEARANSGGKNRSIALAWHVDGEGERRVIWHNGRTGGSSGVIAFAPARGIGVVVLSNSVASVDALGLRLLHHTNAHVDGADVAPDLAEQTQTIAEIT